LEKRSGVLRERDQPPIIIPYSGLDLLNLAWTPKYWRWVERGDIRKREGYHGTSIDHITQAAELKKRPFVDGIKIRREYGYGRKNERSPEEAT
jgi:hypothetical protein